MLPPITNKMKYYFPIYDAFQEVTMETNFNLFK